MPPPGEPGCSRVRPFMDWSKSETSDLDQRWGGWRGATRNRLLPISAMIIGQVGNIRLGLHRAGWGAEKIIANRPPPRTPPHRAGHPPTQERHGDPATRGERGTQRPRFNDSAIRHADRR